MKLNLGDEEPIGTIAMLCFIIFFLLVLKQLYFETEQDQMYNCLINLKKESKNQIKRVLKQKRSHCEMSGDAFLDAIASVGLHMSVCLLVSLFDDGTYISKGICMQHMVQKSASDNGTCCHEYCHKSCHE